MGRRVAVRMTATTDRSGVIDATLSAVMDRSWSALTDQPIITMQE